MMPRTPATSGWAKAGTMCIKGMSGIRTSYALPAETVDQLRALDPRLINESADYQRLLSDLQRN